MTRLAIAGEPGFEISLADAPKASGEPNYTLETLKGLRAELEGDCALYFLMGADSFFGLGKWHRAAEIPFVAALIVASRPGQRLDGLKAELPPGLTMEDAESRSEAREGLEVRRFLLRNEAGLTAEFYLLPGLDVGISASDIRAGIRDGAGDAAGGRALLPAAVAEYVQEHGLYR
jgi:nicotinate-nucleotide adenylyltransferase